MSYVQVWKFLSNNYVYLSAAINVGSSNGQNQNVASVNDSWNQCAPDHIAAWLFSEFTAFLSDFSRNIRFSIVHCIIQQFFAGFWSFVFCEQINKRAASWNRISGYKLVFFLTKFNGIQTEFFNIKPASGSTLHCMRYKVIR